MWFVGIGVLLIVLKLAEFGPVAAWSWWIILAPFLGAVIWWAYADSTGYYQRRSMEKMDAKKRERLTKNMVALGLDQRKKKRF